MRFTRFWLYRQTMGSHRFAKALWLSRQNITAVNRGRPPVSGPFMAELDVTYRCNCKCRMCQRWQNSRTGEMTLSEYRKLAHDFGDMGIHLVSIAGGEPLMREDIFPIVDSFAHHGMTVNLCTNGLLLDRFAEGLCRSGASFVTVSLDGATPGCHDAIRGAPGAHSRIAKNIRSFIGLAGANRPLVRVRMTFSRANLHEVRPFYRQWKDLADDVLLQPVHHSESSYYTGLQDKELRIDPEHLRACLGGTPFQRDGYLTELVKSLRRTGAYPRRRCYAGVLMVRIDPWGSVFPCLEQHVRVGSLRQNDFRTIWHSEAFDAERKSISRDGGCRCWYNNTAMISHFGRWINQTTVQGLRDGRRKWFGADRQTLRGGRAVGNPRLWGEKSF